MKHEIYFYSLIINNLLRFWSNGESVVLVTNYSKEEIEKHYEGKCCKVVIMDTLPKTSLDFAQRTSSRVDFLVK